MFLNTEKGGQRPARNPKEPVRIEAAKLSRPLPGPVEPWIFCCRWCGFWLSSG
jgi:hypothetical protein